MTIEKMLLRDIEESQKALNGPNDDTTYRRDLAKRIELINWVLENMKNPNVQICQVMESRLNEIILKVNQSQDIFESDKLHSEIQILARHWRYRSGLFELKLKLMGGCLPSMQQINQFSHQIDQERNILKRQIINN